MLPCYLWLSTLGRLERHSIVVRKLLAQLITQDTRSTPPLPLPQSGSSCSRLWISQFLFLSESQHYIVAFSYFGLVGPKLREVFVTFFSFKFIPSLFILLPGTFRLVRLGFGLQKRYLCVYHNSEVQIGQIFKFCVTQTIAITTKNPSLKIDNFDVIITDHARLHL